MVRQVHGAVTAGSLYPAGTEWLADAGLGPPHRGTFGDLRVWVAETSFPAWPVTEARDHSLNCQKGRNLVNHRGEMSCAEIEIVRRFRDTSVWRAGWLATCGQRNPVWRRFMYTPTAPKRSVLDVPIEVLPPDLAALVLRGGRSGWPDVISWDESRAQVVFIEAKGPGDDGTSQVPWIAQMRRARRLRFNQFVLVEWTLR